METDDVVPHLGVVTMSRSSSRSARRPGLPAALALAVLLGGCGGPSGPAVPTTTAPADATTAPTPTAPASTAPPPTGAPTAAPSPSGPPAAADLVLSPAGLGPLTVGVPAEGNPGAAMITWDADHCAGLVDAAEAGRWVPDGYGPATRADGSRSDTLFGVAVDDGGVVVWIDVYGTAPRTVEGVGVGSTLQDVLAAFPDLSAPFAGPLSQVTWVTRDDGILVFESTLGDPELPDGTVVLARVLAPASDPAFATWRTDWTAGGCL